VEEDMKARMMRPHYSGDLSTSWWKRVNALRGEDRAVMYALGCVLQNLEGYVLGQLQNAETAARGAVLDATTALERARCLSIVEGWYGGGFDHSDLRDMLTGAILWRKRRVVPK
jgi:hypothetical protein